MLVQGPIGTGQLTPAGHLLKYNVNGFRCWVITHILYVIFGYFIPIFPLSIVHDNWGGILVAANVLGYFMTFFSYFKAHYLPSHAGDRKFSGSRLYDLFMGIEFNPRLGEWFDFKLFFNGRPGIVAWTLIDLSFAAAQYNQLGYVTNSMVLLNVLHAFYVVDYFWNEDWYLRTIDIAHDHFGFYLAWGDCVLLPYMYTLQSHYLVRNPIDMSTPYFLFVTALGLTGYYIFRTVNNQKDLVRKEDGKCLIWGKPARIIRASYITSDGKKHTSVLLTSGYWGISRHFNYLGDLMLSLAMCMTCGFDHWLPYFYIVWMTCLLGHRVERDSKRCHGKYGEYWDQYCKLVPYKVIPYVY
jgi:7-dehydrocholesterol reductase